MTMARLQQLFREKIAADLTAKFGYKSPMQVPRITKITLNMGVSEAVADKKVMDHAVGDLTKIAGQKPVVTKARKAIAASDEPAERVRLAVRAIAEVMYAHRREILLIYQDSHLLDSRSRRVILARVEEFIGMFERIIVEAAAQLGVEMPHPHLSANMLTFLPVMIALRGWSLKTTHPPEVVIAEITTFVMRGLGFCSPAVPPEPRAPTRRRVRA
jgi:hypothetical protein